LAILYTGPASRDIGWRTKPVQLAAWSPPGTRRACLKRGLPQTERAGTSAPQHTQQTCGSFPRSPFGCLVAARSRSSCDRVPGKNGESPEHGSNCRGFDSARLLRLSSANMRRSRSSATPRIVRDLRGARALRVRAFVGVAAVLLQLALPVVHSLEVHVASAELAAAWESNGSSPEIARLAQTAGTPGIAGPSSSRHDPLNCPICTALSNVHAAALDAARIPATLESGRPIIAAACLTPPSCDFASADARAPPSSQLIAIS
jgi:hypothetical protein